MNLGIAGRRALVCGASKGLGRACALARKGVAATLLARTAAKPGFMTGQNIGNDGGVYQGLF
jgi:NAD(P)-dependent dehydrogenase (short-subunit alcohol dehydrogenase family)